ncbi:hypothetical protein A8C75_12030 [Marinobacterium aestuarii]|uniref:Glyoxalase/fosfomycin resistance/dioxygenase domain-containing protein n=1 Tax=Marinobacterium aestuarii TaxID=1821621 RepID=A0A1A9F030_9GAMM|nr:hypothetical protein A8C75_12030 [Marinobacterium aestuarii]
MNNVASHDSFRPRCFDLGETDQATTTLTPGVFYIHDGSTFSVSEPINGEPVTTANGSTIGFVCNSPEQLKEFHDVAVANGGITAEDPPGPRESTMGVIHLCYFLDPDGHKICGIHRPD